MKPYQILFKKCTQERERKKTKNNDQSQSMQNSPKEACSRTMGDHAENSLAGDLCEHENCLAASDD